MSQTPLTDAKVVPCELCGCGTPGVHCSRWISIKDRLPDGDGAVLTIWHSGGMEVQTKMFVRVMALTGGGDPDDDCFVTHWMPLPEPPL